MGLFDELNGGQVKCFYVPWYSRCNDRGGYISSSAGLCRYYSNGDEVPYKTWYYDYTKNFIIYDEYDKVIHIIKDAKVVDTLHLERLENLTTEEKIEHFKGNERLISYYGNEYAIKDIEEFSRFMGIYNEYGSDSQLLMGYALEYSKEAKFGEVLHAYNETHDITCEDREVFKRQLEDTNTNLDKYLEWYGEADDTPEIVRVYNEIMG